MYDIILSLLKLCFWTVFSCAEHGQCKNGELRIKHVENIQLKIGLFTFVRDDKL